jgi:aminotransferase
VIAPPEQTNAIRKVHDFLTVGAAAPLQEGGAAAMQLPAGYYRQLAEGYRERRDLLCGALEKLGFGLARPDGAYYVMCDTSRLDPDGDDTAFAERLVREAGVATVPGSSFFTNKELGRRKIRFAFPKRLETLQLAAERLQAFA